MTKKERIEDLGIIYQRLNTLVSDFESDFPYFDSKHAYETFQADMSKDDFEKLDDLHRRLRFLISELNEIIYIAQGDYEPC